MNDDVRGYAMQTAYPITYQRELSPTWLNYAAVLGGAAPRDAKRPFRYLELGCGRGYSALVHAASHPGGVFHACDRDADAIDGARAWAKALDVRNIQFHAGTFGDGLPDEPFDVIVLHGVYSWVDAPARATIRALLRDRLAPGGLAYVSYNCLPGWADELPLRRLLGELIAASQGSGDRIAAAVAELQRLRATGLSYFATHPAAERAVASWTEQPAGYLAHEYLAEACEPMWSVDVADEMAQIGLSFAASATLRDNHEALLVDEATSRALAALATPRLRQIALDFAVNRAFRRDVFVRGAVGGEASGAVRDLVIGCPGEIPGSILVPRGRVTFRAEFIAALQRLMAAGALRLGDAVAALGDNPVETARNLLWLVAAGALAPAGPASALEAQAREKLRHLGVQPSA